MSVSIFHITTTITPRTRSSPISSDTNLHFAHSIRHHHCLAKTKLPLPVLAAHETLYSHPGQPHSAPAFSQSKPQTYVGPPHQLALFPSGLQSRGPDDSYPTSRVRVQPKWKPTSLIRLQPCRRCEFVLTSGRSGN
jgi:hypothetical protein